MANNVFPGKIPVPSWALADNMMAIALPQPMEGVVSGNPGDSADHDGQAALGCENPRPVGYLDDQFAVHPGKISSDSFFATDPMTNIETKICGVTCIEDAQQAIEAGASAIGLNFYAKSKRYIEVDVAAAICRELGHETAFVGVFVNSNTSQVCNIAEKVGLSHVQLHGDEAAEMVAAIKQRLPKLLVVRAIRTRGSQLQEAQAEIELWQDAGADWMLLDAAADGVFGGSGKTLDWNRVSELNFRVPWLLAGGLGPENVARALRLARPSGVDVASGVEIEPGKKCAASVTSFIRAAKASLADPS